MRAMNDDLRRASLYRGLVRAARVLAPEGVVAEPYEKLEELPFFNQGVEGKGDPAPVRELKDKIREADAVLIATPEYGYAVPGVLTNALDRALRSPSPLRHKPVGIVGASPGGAGETGDPTDEQTRERMRRFLDALVDWTERLATRKPARDRRPA